MQARNLFTASRLPQSRRLRHFAIAFHCQFDFVRLTIAAVAATAAEQETILEQLPKLRLTIAAVAATAAEQETILEQLPKLRLTIAAVAATAAAHGRLGLRDRKST